MTPAPHKSAPAESLVTRSQLLVACLFIIAHVALAIAMNVAPVISTFHAIGTTLVGIVYAAITTRIRHVALIVAYCAGAEVLWRMTKASIFWEYGKYSIIAVLLVALVRISIRSNRRLAIVYLAFLLPSAALTFATLDLGLARQEVAFNLSGPVTLTFAVLFFSNITITPAFLRYTFVAFIAPATGIAALTLISTRRATELEFGDVANVVTSGGFGPNQVSSVLGLCVMMWLLLSLDRSLGIRLRAAVLVLGALFAAQAALTFSRGGIVIALAGTCAAMFTLMRGNRRGRRNVALVAGLSVVLGVYVIEPRLEAFTKGKLGERYANTKSSGRDAFALSELAMFRDHPLLGVGPGVGRTLRSSFELRPGPSHTEYTRMLGEHGILGAISLYALIALGIRAWRRARDVSARAVAIALLVWAGLFWAIYGTRIAAPAAIFGLAFVMRAPRHAPRAPGNIRA